MDKPYITTPSASLQVGPGAALPRIVFHQSERLSVETFGAMVREGLGSTPKRLSPVALYDALGSALFEAICELPEYDLTRNEISILAEHLDDMIAAAAGGDAAVDVVELGSGSARKGRLFLEHLLRHQGSVEYHAVDVSRTALEAMAQTLAHEFADVRVHAHIADYASELESGRLRGSRRSLVLFLGSSIGNYDPAAARDLLGAASRAFEPGDALLLGTDLKKEPAVLTAAYDDPTGVTKAFILNGLGRINRELGGRFDLRSFRHVVLYDAERGSVDAFLESTMDQDVAVEALSTSFSFKAGERIHMESSRKYALPDVEALARVTGWRLERSWTDRGRRFAVNLLRMP